MTDVDVAIAAAAEVGRPDDGPIEESPAPIGEDPARNVVDALLRVMRDLPAIGKEGTGPSTQGSYKFRGIEQITRHASVLFARHGVLFTPHHADLRASREFASGGKISIDEIVVMTYRVYGPGGRDDFIDVETVGVGRDQSDKGANKAMTAAFKYALTQTLCVSDEKDDGDAAAIYAEQERPRDDSVDFATPEQIAMIRGRVRDLRGRGVDDVAEVTEDSELIVLGVPVLVRWPELDNRLAPPATMTVEVADGLIVALGERLDAAPPPEKVELLSTSPIPDPAKEDAEKEEERLDQSTCPSCGANVNAMNVLHDPDGPCDLCAPMDVATGSAT